MIGLAAGLFLVGGFPVEFVGRSIERYQFQTEQWEGISIILPKPIANAGLVPNTGSGGDGGFLILGGRFSQTVYNVDLDGEVRVYKAYKHETPLETEVPPLAATNRGIVFVLRYRENRLP
jgi:hypothetical protein